jgi:transposase
MTAKFRCRLFRLIVSISVAPSGGRRGTGAARKLSRGRILLKADEQEGWTDVAIADAFDVGVRTVERLRQRFVEQGLEACLNHVSQPRTPRIVDVETIPHETIRQTLKKTN